MNRACSHCTGICNQGRLCPASTEASRRAFRVFIRVFGPYVAAMLIALALAAAPVALDGEGPQADTTTTTGSRP
jgi:hypothetical protein